MLDSVKYGLIFAAGGLVGSLVTYYIVEKHYREFYRNLAESEIESVKESYGYNHIKKGYKSDYIGDYIAPEEASDDRKKDSPSRVLTSSLDGYSSKRDKESDVDYTRFFVSDPAEYEHPEDDCDISEEEKVKADASEKDMIHDHAVKTEQEPVLISESEYNYDFTHYDQEDLIYYAGNDILIYSESDVGQELYEVVDNEKELLGDLLEDGCFAGDPNMDVMFVRNDRLGIKYAVTKVEGNYEG